MKSINSIWMVVLLAGWCFVISSCTPGANVEKKERSIKVTGSSEMEITPNQFYVVIQIQEYYTAGKKIELDKIQKNLEIDLDSLGIESKNISIDRYAAYDYWWYWYYYKQQIERSMTITVKLDNISKVGMLFRDLKTKGISNMYLSKMEHSEMNKLRLEVKSNALKAAKLKAEYLLGALNKNVGDVIYIEEVPDILGSDFNSNINTVYKSNLTTKSGESNTPNEIWNPTTIKLRYEIIAEFEIL